MMKFGLSFEEYVDFKIKPHRNADPVFRQAASLEIGAMFPMALTVVSNHLRSRGYDCRPQMLEVLIEGGTVTPASRDAWSKMDVEAAANYFEECGMFTPYAAMCEAMGCSYADFLRPLQEAADRESARYGRRVNANDQYFVMHRHPPRDDTPAIITFTLCDDIRARLERGEGV
ncbi:MAG: hypothetical protein FWD61_01165 [Phycisphaerales bacterium]|nr:hypothetical protein [Phycisphaerales bacterium]